MTGLERSIVTYCNIFCNLYTCMCECGYCMYMSLHLSIISYIHMLYIYTCMFVAGSCITSDDTVTRDIHYDGHPIQERCTVITRIAPSFIRSSLHCEVYIHMYMYMYFWFVHFYKKNWHVYSFIPTALHVCIKEKLTYIPWVCCVAFSLCYLAFRFSVCNVHVCIYNVYIHSYVHVITRCTVH